MTIFTIAILAGVGVGSLACRNGTPPPANVSPNDAYPPNSAGEGAVTVDQTGSSAITPDKKEPGLNRLAREKSPYLLQHAGNPVDWYPWGEEAFAKARAEDKPIFLSIGYATCHWCHVMEHESFEDPAVAGLMNEAFVCIKVDREERPDIDGIYMTVCQMMTGSGGWPLTVIMTPDRKPFFAGTYFPKESRFGRIGMLDLVPRLQDAWKSQRADILASAGRIVDGLREATLPRPGKSLDEVALGAAYLQLADRFDPQHGGFGHSPKFPGPHDLLFLLRHWKRTGDGQALHMVERTLQAMRRGGIWDHVGLGFHRYSTDREWLLPHFEKMLYDQALIAMACTEAWQATGKPEYETTAREIFTYVLRDMTDPKGGFYTAEDADSEGEEGKFYVWTVEELQQVLGEKEAAFTASVYGVEPGGNYTDEASRRRTGANILHLPKPIEELAADTGTTSDDVRNRLDAARRKLFEVREKRVHPLKDDKILVDWNGLMIAALAKAARAFDEPAYEDAAQRCARFLLVHMRREDGRLLHRWRSGEAGIHGHLDDYAFLVWGLIELYETTFDAQWLTAAAELNAVQLEDFLDEDAGGFFFTADNSEDLIARQKEIYDGAVPSGNSVAMLNMLRLSRLTGDPALEAQAARLARSVSSSVAQAPAAYAMLMCAVDFAVGPSFEIVIAGAPDAPDTGTFLTALRQRFLPNKVVLLRPAGPGADEDLPDYVKDYGPVDGKAAAYVCRTFECQRPVTDAAQMLELLGTLD